MLCNSLHINRDIIMNRGTQNAAYCMCSALDKKE